MEIQRLKYFLSVHHEKSFSKAALACHISQPSLSNQIIKLEQEVGGALFIRDRAGIILTELGMRFLPHAQAIIAEVNKAYDFTEQRLTQLQHPIKIGAIPTIAPYLLPHLVAFIKERHPEAQFEIVEDTTAAQLNAFRNRQLDYCLLSPPIDMDLCHHEVLTDELLLTLPIDHPLTQQESVSLHDLDSEELILLTDEHCLSQQTKGYCKTAGLNPNVSIKSSQISTLLGFIESGMGFTFTPKIATPAFLNRQVKFLSISPSPFSRSIHLSWLREHQHSLTHRLLANTISSWQPT